MSMMNSLAKVLVATVSLAALPISGSVPEESFAGAAYPVRVAVVKDADYVVLSIKGAYQVRGLPLMEPMKESRNLKKAQVRPTYSGLLLGDEEFKIYGINIKAKDASDITVNGRRFRGELDIIRTADMKLTVVNHIDIEDYVKGVLYHEVSHRWPDEVLKAQAIASRTFAVYKSMESKNADYDMTSDVFSQVYGGRTSEKSRTNKAVRDTAGQVLLYKNKILAAYFHATCGGHTEDAGVMWNMDSPPLKGRPCHYCKGSPHLDWVAEEPLFFVEEQLQKAGYKIKEISGITCTGKDRSGRVVTVDIYDSLGTERIPAHKFRLALGPDLIRSANFTVQLKGDNAVFKGRGWGHGAGMCQWGAYFMAKEGFSAADILRFYYPGATLADMQVICSN